MREEVSTHVARWGQNALEQLNPSTAVTHPGERSANGHAAHRTSSRSTEREGLKNGAQSETLFALDDAVPPVASISIVVPCHNEEGNLPELHRRLVESLEGIGLPFEIIIIDDGSTDGTWRTIAALHATDRRVKALRHRRNFGKAEALANGFAVAQGEAIITMDGDLQDDPSELPRFINALNSGYDLVSGWKKRRKDPLGKTFPSKIFNWTVRRVSGVPLHDFNCGFKAYRREVAKNLRLYGELHRFTPVLAEADGFRIGELAVQHHPRTWGRSKYGWSRLVKGFLDLLTVTFLTQYRHRPMHLFGLPGLLAMGIGVLIGLWLSADKIFTGAEIGQRPMLLLAVLLVVIGAQFFGLGLLGELLTHDSNAPRKELRGHIRNTLGIEGSVSGRFLERAPETGQFPASVTPRTARASAESEHVAAGSPSADD